MGASDDAKPQSRCLWWLDGILMLSVMKYLGEKCSVEEYSVEEYSVEEFGGFDCCWCAEILWRYCSDCMVKR